MKPEHGEPDRDHVRFSTALGWSYVMQGGQYVITTIVTFVLAAILGPEIFGLVAMAMVYLMFIQLLVHQGMIPALVQRRDLAARHINSAFWLTVGSGMLFTIASVLSSKWWAGVNRTPDLAPVINSLSVVIFLQSLVVVQQALLSRQMDFRSLAVRTNSAALVGGTVGLVLAFTGFGVWALVAQNIAKAIVDVVVLWGLSDWRPQFQFSWSAAKDLLGFSASTTLVGFGDFVNNRGDALLVGLFFGPTAVGIYRLAVRMVELVVDVTVRSFQSVSLPELSRLQDDPRRFADRITNMISSTSLITLPALGILAGSSGAVTAVIGEEWSAAAAPLSILCIVGAVRAITTFTSPVVLAVGRPRNLALVTWITAVVSAASFVVAGLLLVEAPLAAQVLGLAVARVGFFSTAVLGLGVWLILRNSETSLQSLGRSVVPATLATAVAFVSAWLLTGIPWAVSDISRLILVVVPSLTLTAGVLWWIEPGVRQLYRKTIQMARGA